MLRALRPCVRAAAIRLPAAPSHGRTAGPMAQLWRRGLATEAQLTKKHAKFGGKLGARPRCAPRQLCSRARAQLSMTVAARACEQ
jgi:hypothetical protein